MKIETIHSTPLVPPPQPTSQHSGEFIRYVFSWVWGRQLTHTRIGRHLIYLQDVQMVRTCTIWYCACAQPFGPCFANNFPEKKNYRKQRKSTKRRTKSENMENATFRKGPAGENVWPGRGFPPKWIATLIDNVAVWEGIYPNAEEYSEKKVIKVRCD